MTELRVAVLGATGRMGGALLRAIDETPGARLIGATASAGSRWLNHDAGVPAGGPVRGVAVTADVRNALRTAQVAIDFALPEATIANVDACAAAGVAMVVGTTGLSAHAREHIDVAAKKIPIVQAANMSLGVNLLAKLVEIAGRALNDSYDIEVFEAHHRNKKDAPSGTALALGHAAAAGRGVTLDTVATYERYGETGARVPGTIGFSVFRGGDVVGDHTVTFAGIGERIELTHRASDRMTFARGALRAAQWVVVRSPGLYSMQDVLGLS